MHEGWRGIGTLTREEGRCWGARERAAVVGGGRGGSRDGVSLVGVLMGVAARKNEVGDHGGVGLYVGWNEGGMRPRGEERSGTGLRGKEWWLSMGGARNGAAAGTSDGKFWLTARRRFDGKDRQNENLVERLWRGGEGNFRWEIMGGLVSMWAGTRDSCGHQVEGWRQGREEQEFSVNDVWGTRRCT